MTVLMEVKGRKGHELNTGQSTGHVRCVCTCVHVCMCAHVCMRVSQQRISVLHTAKMLGTKKGHGSALGLRNHSTTQDI